MSAICPARPSMISFNAPALMKLRMSAKIMFSITKTHSRERRALVSVARADISILLWKLTLLVRRDHYGLTVLVCQQVRRPDRTGTATGGAPSLGMKGGKGPRETLDRERVVRAAMDLADERGIESLSMRELGRRLGVEAASLYNHVAGKDDVLDGMVEQVVTQIDVPGEDVDWKDAMRRRAVSARAVFARHPWAAGLIDSRERSGPVSLSYVDRVLGVLLRAGFSPRTAGTAFLTLDSFIYGYERQRSYIASADDEDDDAGEPAREVVEASREAFPSLMLVAGAYLAEPFDDDAAFAFGLGLILDGLERLLDGD